MAANDAGKDSRRGDDDGPVSLLERELAGRGERVS
jgi:hypothetical protein